MQVVFGSDPPGLQDHIARLPEPSRKPNLQEIAAIRGVPVGHTVLSPPGHSAFTTPTGLLKFSHDRSKKGGGTLSRTVDV